MKILRVKIKREENENSTHLSYPKPFWDSQKVTFGPVYENIQRGEGRKHMYCIIGVNDFDATQFLKGNGKMNGDHVYTVIELSKEEAIIIGDTWLPVVEKIMDSNRVLASLVNKARGTDTKDDEDVLDPEKPGGFSKTKSFKDILEDAIKKH